MRRIIPLVALLSSWTPLLSGRADAAEPKAKSEVEQLIDKGVELREAGKDAEALDQFRKAYELSKGGRALAQLALAEQALGRWVDAETHLKAALDTKEDKWVRANRQALDGALRTIQQRLGNLEILSNVNGAELRLNGVSIGRLPLGPARAVAGSVVVELSADGYWPATRSVLVPAGGFARETVDLAPMNRPSAAAAPSPAPVAPAAPEASAPAIRASEEAPPPARSGLSPWIWVGGGTTALAVAAGFIALGVRNGHISSYNSDDCLVSGRTRAENCGGSLSAGETAGTVSAASFIGAGAVGIATLLWWALAPSDQAQTAGPSPNAKGVVLEF